MNTKKMLDMAIEAAGLKECPADSAVLVEGKNIKRALVGLEVNNAELALAKTMGYDVVVGHHPRTSDLKGCSKLLETLPYEAPVAAGMRPLEAEKAVAGRAAKADREKNAMNHNREASGAAVMGLPFMCINSPANAIAEKKIQRHLDERFSDKPLTLLGDVVDALTELPEYSTWSIKKPVIAVGDAESHAGRIIVVMNGLAEGGMPDPYSGIHDDVAIIKAFFKAGADTVVLPYLAGDVKALKEAKLGNVIVGGHMPMDSVGMNALIALWEAEGVKVDRFSGIMG